MGPKQTRESGHLSLQPDLGAHNTLPRRERKPQHSSDTPERKGLEREAAEAAPFRQPSAFRVQVPSGEQIKQQRAVQLVHPGSLLPPYSTGRAPRAQGKEDHILDIISKRTGCGRRANFIPAAPMPTALPGALLCQGPHSPSQTAWPAPHHRCHTLPCGDPSEGLSAGPSDCQPFSSLHEMVLILISPH